MTRSEPYEGVPGVCPRCGVAGCTRLERRRRAQVASRVTTIDAKEVARRAAEIRREKGAK